MAQEFYQLLQMKLKTKTMVESWMDLTFQNDVKVKAQQVAVQTWDGDYIVNETFYHK